MVANPGRGDSFGRMERHSMRKIREVLRLRENYGIYMADSGRFNVVGMSDEQIDRFVSAIAECIDG